MASFARNIGPDHGIVCFYTKTWGEGAGWFAQNLVQALAQTGMVVTFVAPAAVPQAREPKHPNIARITTRRESGAGNKVAGVLSSLGRVLDGVSACIRQRSVSPNYIFSIPDPLVFFLLLQIVLKLTAANQVLIVHDALPHSWSLPRGLRVIQYAALWLSYRLASRLVTTTSDGKSDLVHHFGISDEAIDVIPHGPLELGSPSPLPGNGIFLIFGALRRNKQILECIKAVQK